MEIDRADWRDIGDPERRLAAAIIKSSGVAGWENLLQELDGAQVRNESEWILDIHPEIISDGAQVPNGPLPVRTYVPSREKYEGEILVWVESGHLSGIEYAWVTDDLPGRWPNPDSIQIFWA